MKLDDLYGITFPALRIDSPAMTDTDRPRLIRRVKAMRHGFREAHIVPYAEAPFDARWLYLDAGSLPLQSDRRTYVDYVASGTDWMGVGAGAPFVTRLAAVGGLRMIPLHVVTSEWSEAQRRYLTSKSPNLARSARQFLLRLGLGEDDLFHHAVAVLAAGRDAVHIPLPEDRARIRMSALLGYRVARLFTGEDSIIVRPHEHELRAVSIPTRIGKEARMLRGSVLLVDDLWRNGERVAMRPYAPDEMAALREHAAASGVGLDELLLLVGAETCDVYLNEKAYWKNVPRAVWQEGSLRAWLRDRCAGSLERPLNREEVMHFAAAARRIASLMLLQPALERNAEATEDVRRATRGGSPPPWSAVATPPL